MLSNGCCLISKFLVHHILMLLFRHVEVRDISQARLSSKMQTFKMRCLATHSIQQNSRRFFMSSFFIYHYLSVMIQLTAIIEQFAKKGEKTGWTYLYIPQPIANELKPGCKVSFRVKGEIDQVPFKGIALAPMGEGNFIMPLKKELQKKLAKRKGATINLKISEDKDFKIEMPDDLKQCLEDSQGALNQFYTLPKSHQNYYFNWINSAKTDATRVKRIAQTIGAMEMKMTYNEMIRFNKSKK